jgi:pimeloyl-ACP methyl ester carboxylesterase
MARGSTIPLLLLPGLLCDGRVWQAQVDALAPLTIAVDTYGPADSIVGMAKMVLDGAPSFFNIAGHSMGARVALEIYRLAPERVVGLALISTGVHAVRPDEAEKRRALLALGRSEGVERLLDQWLPPMVHPDLRYAEQPMSFLREMCAAGGVDLYAAQIEAMLKRPALDDLLPNITCPTLVGVGRQDEWSPLSQHQAIAAAIPESTLTVFENCGHFAPVEAPEQVTAALHRWLTERTPG